MSNLGSKPSSESFAQFIGPDPKLVAGMDGGYWTLNVAGKEYVLVGEPLFRAAAIAPLQEKETVGELAFEVNEFLELALQETDTEGTA